MIRILVCFKITYDLENLAPREVQNYCDGDENLSFIKRIIGSFDEAALEIALRIADEGKENGLDVELSAITVGKCEERYANILFAIGYKEVINISGNEKVEYDPEKVAEYICKYAIEKGPYDVIVTGRQVGLGENAQTPFIIAERLGLPCISNVKEMCFIGNKIRAKSKTDTGYSSRTVNCPAVYTIGNAIHPYLRIPTLREILFVSSKKILEYVPDKFVAKLGKMHRQALIFEDQEKNCIFIEGDTIQDKIQYLFKNYIKDVV